MCQQRTRGGILDAEVDAKAPIMPGRSSGHCPTSRDVLSPLCLLSTSLHFPVPIFATQPAAPTSAGSGKTQLAHALLGAGDGAATAPPAASTSASAPPQPAFPAVHPFQGATKGVSVLRGSAHGIGLVFVDTPGLSLAPGGAARNSQVLQQIRRCVCGRAGGAWGGWAGL